MPLNLTWPEAAFLVGLWLLMAFLASLLARRLGHSRPVWTVIGLILGPLAPFVLLWWSGRGAAAPGHHDGAEGRREPTFAVADEARREPYLDRPSGEGSPRRPRPAGEAGERLKQCPRCAELVRVEAAVCRFCGNPFEQTAEIRPLRPDPRRQR